MTPRKPEIQILAIWRIALALIALVPAFLTSLLLKIGSTAWLVATGIWVLLFLYIYLIYFPLLYKSITFRLTFDKIVLTTGVFFHRVISLPLNAIRFTTVFTPVFGRPFNLSNLIVTAAGGRVVLHGLKTSDAKALALALKP